MSKKIVFEGYLIKKFYRLLKLLVYIFVNRFVCNQITVYTSTMHLYHLSNYQISSPDINISRLQSYSEAARSEAAE